MIAAAMIALTMAAEVPAALLARWDRAASTYVQCLFGVVRASGAAHLSQSAFEQRFEGSCRAEQQAQHELGVRILRLRGERAPEQAVDALDRQLRQGMIEDYRTLPDKQRMVEQLETLCRANPQDCR